MLEPISSQQRRSTARYNGEGKRLRALVPIRDLKRGLSENVHSLSSVRLKSQSGLLNRMIREALLELLFRHDSHRSSRVQFEVDWSPIERHSYYNGRLRGISL